jgi:hypothetical protein
VAGGWFKSMSIVDELESAFKSQASFSNTSELLFTHRVALEIIENCAKKGILILGMDFYVRDGHDYKELLSSADFSDLKGKPDAVHQAVMSAKKLIAEDLPEDADFVSFVLDDAS